MTHTAEALLQLTAADLMAVDLFWLPERMPLREAARVLFQKQVSGAPVVDGNGKCVGVLSASDFLRWARGIQDKHTSPHSQESHAAPCTFLTRDYGPEGEPLFRCALPVGTCPLQGHPWSEEGQLHTLCSQPHAVPVDWQMVEWDALPEDAVGRYMTADPVTVAADTPLPQLARCMVDAHIHRVIVVDERNQLQGIVSSTDILGALARCGMGA